MAGMMLSKRNRSRYGATPFCQCCDYMYDKKFRDMEKRRVRRWEKKLARLDLLK